MKMIKCPKCNGTDIDKGTLDSAGPSAYCSQVHKIVFKDNCFAYVCMDCGYMELYVTDEYRNKIIDKRQKMG